MKEEILELLSDQTYTRRKIQELAEHFHMTETQDYVAFIKLINEMEDEGLIIRSRINDYYLFCNVDIVGQNKIWPSCVCYWRKFRGGGAFWN